MQSQRDDSDTGGQQRPVELQAEGYETNNCTACSDSASAQLLAYRRWPQAHTTCLVCSPIADGRRLAPLVLSARGRPNGGWFLELTLFIWHHPKNKKSKEINELKLLDRTVDQRFVDLEIRELTA